LIGQDAGGGQRVVQIGRDVGDGLLGGPIAPIGSQRQEPVGCCAPKLAYLSGLDAHTLGLSVLPAQRRRFLAGVGRRLTEQG
jgi:hypothetical protein